MNLWLLAGGVWLAFGCGVIGYGLGWMLARRVDDA